jgi:hypothetical protein
MLALSGTLMASLPWHLLAAIFVAAAAFAPVLDQIKLMVIGTVRIE